MEKIFILNKHLNFTVNYSFSVIVTQKPALQLRSCQRFSLCVKIKRLAWNFDRNTFKFRERKLIEIGIISKSEVVRDRKYVEIGISSRSESVRDLNHFEIRITSFVTRTDLFRLCRHFCHKFSHNYCSCNYCKSRFEVKTKESYLVVSATAT